MKPLHFIIREPIPWHTEVQHSYQNPPPAWTGVVLTTPETFPKELYVLVWDLLTSKFLRKIVDHGTC